MPTINVRIDEALRDALQQKADQEDQSVSDFVRDAIANAVFDFRSPSADDRVIDPKTIDPLERHKLALLHRILARVLPEDANGVDGDHDYQIERAEVLENGYVNEYWTEFAGLRAELTESQSALVMDVLDMFRIAGYSMDAIEEEAGAIDDTLRRRLTFRGFDHNDTLERQMSNYVTYLVKDDRWSEQAEFVLGPKRGNSHMPMINAYSRMLTVYREVKETRRPAGTPKSYLLSIEELERIAGTR